MKKAIILILAVWGLGMGAGVKGVTATGSFSLVPASGSYVVGSTFTVLVGVNSGEDQMAGIDVRGSFDSSKVEILSIEAVSGAAAWSFLDYDESTTVFDNAAGTFASSLSASSTGTGITGQTVNEVLLRLNFRAKAVGIAAVNFRCEEGSVSESNLINTAAIDVVLCSSNQSGSYEITAGSSQTTATPATGGSSSGATSTPASQLPQTGGAASTVGLLVFGAISLFSALMLKFI